MFGFLKKKLKAWKDKVKDEVVEEVKENIEEKKKSKKVEKKKAEKKTAPLGVPQVAERGGEKKVSKDKTSKKTEIEVPVKFNVGTKQYEPDVKKLKEMGDNIDNALKEEVASGEYIEPPIKPISIDGVRAVDIKKIEEKPVKKKGFFKRLVSSKIIFTQENFDKHKEDLEFLLLENNVAFEVVDNVINKLQGDLVGKEVSKKEMDDIISDSLREIISDILVEPPNIIEEIKSAEKPYVILFCGINGTGKTTSIAKIATLLKKNKLSSVMAAGDTFRAASIEQLKIHADKVGVPIVTSDYGHDPASVGFDAIAYAKKNKIDVVLIDTAGRMHTAKNLLSEIGKVARVCKPDLKLFVGESIAGNDIVEQVKAFDEEVDLSGIILSKADIDEKGGTILSVGQTTGKPILFLGTGQGYGDLEVFNKKTFLDKLFG